MTRRSIEIGCEPGSKLCGHCTLVRGYGGLEGPRYECWHDGVTLELDADGPLRSSECVASEIGGMDLLHEILKRAKECKHADQACDLIYWINNTVDADTTWRSWRCAPHHYSGHGALSGCPECAKRVASTAPCPTGSRQARHGTDPDCVHCYGAGWVTRDELPGDRGAWDGHSDDTHYSCPWCADRDSMVSESPCEHFTRAPEAHRDCHSDGHYMCKECTHYEPDSEEDEFPSAEGE